MKKFFVMIMAAVLAVMSLNAQNYLSESKFTDNWYIGINGGATTPLSFDKVFPVNATAGLRIGKDFSPVFGANIEGTTWFGSRVDNGTYYNTGYFDWGEKGHHAFRATNVGLNGTINLMNLFGGYNGKPRVFEATAIAGIGWWHTFVCGGEDYDDLSAKTGLDLTFNLGSSKASALYIEPAVIWNLTYWNGSAPRRVEFNKNYAQFALSVGYVYHFMNSNGEHYFTKVDGVDNSEINALNDQINELRAELAKKPTEVEVIKEVVVEKIVSKGDIVVTFAKGSSDLTKTAMDMLNTIPAGTKVAVEATASPEGGSGLNMELSEERAAEVGLYLKNRGVNVVSEKGLGVTGPDSQRIARVILK